MDPGTVQRRSRVYLFAFALLVWPLPISAHGQVASSHAAKARYEVLYRFKGFPNSSGPSGPLLITRDGSLIGVAGSGGLGGPSCPGGCGTIYKLTRKGSTYQETLLHSFHGPPDDGEAPTGGLIVDPSGALYGVTAYGGASPTSRCEHGGFYPYCVYGTVFELTPYGSGYTERLLHTFQGWADGATPVGGLAADSTGALYGATINGGNIPGCFSCGSIFKLTPQKSGGYAETVLMQFNGYDGFYPDGTLFVDASGALYGTAEGGGTHDGGTVFKLNPGPSGYTESTLYNFPGSRTDGWGPGPNVIVDSAGPIFLATAAGGDACLPGGCGTVIRLMPGDEGYAETVVYNFRGGGADGMHPGPLLQGQHGIFYGTTAGGGYNGGDCFGYSCGVVFELVPSRRSPVEDVILHAFTDRPDGAGPSGLTLGKNGALYGTTADGGDYHCDCGTVFRVIP